MLPVCSYQWDAACQSQSCRHEYWIESRWAPSLINVLSALPPPLSPLPFSSRHLCAVSLCFFSLSWIHFYVFLFLPRIILRPACTHHCYLVFVLTLFLIFPSSHLLSHPLLFCLINFRLTHYIILNILNPPVLEQFFLCLTVLYLFRLPTLICSQHQVPHNIWLCLAHLKSQFYICSVWKKAKRKTVDCWVSLSGRAGR